MERSQHSILVGEGAQQFAKEHGIPVLSNELLQTESSTKAYKVFQCFSSLRAKFKIDICLQNTSYFKFRDLIRV